jgi:hypothetical protein
MEKIHRRGLRILDLAPGLGHVLFHAFDLFLILSRSKGGSV